VPVASRELDVCGDHTTVKGLCLALYARAFVGTLQPLLRTGAVLSAALGGLLAWSELCLLLQWLVRIGAFPWLAAVDGPANEPDPLGPVLLLHALLVAAQGSASPLHAVLLLLSPLLWMRFCVGWALRRMAGGSLSLRREPRGNDSGALLLYFSDLS